MTHDEIRDLLSARADGEPYDAAALAAHLDTCADCTAYATGLDRVRTLTAALPREPAPAGLDRRVTRRIGWRTARRRAWLLAPAVAAATALVLTTGGPATFPLRPAAAATQLLDLRSLYVERTLTTGTTTTTERIWWRAPGSVRIERRTPGQPDELTIETPGSRYADGVLTTNVAPTITLPEPLSPTVALFGRDTGPGPLVLGLGTRRFDLTIGGQSRVAYLTGANVVTFGEDASVVVQKTSSRVTKRVTVLRLDPDLGDDLFTPPRGGVQVADGGFHDRPLGDLSIDPKARPDGFTVVRAGSGPGGEAVLFAHRSLPVLVTTGGATGDEPYETRTEQRGERTFLVVVGLYGAPAVEVRVADRAVTVRAPLPVDALVDLAARMYPE